MRLTRRFLSALLLSTQAVAVLSLDAADAGTWRPDFACPMDPVPVVREREEARCDHVLCALKARRVGYGNQLAQEYAAALNALIGEYNMRCTAMELAGCAGEQETECKDGEKKRMHFAYTGGARGTVPENELGVIPDHRRFEDTDDLIRQIDENLRKPIDRNGVCRDCLDYLRLVQHGREGEVKFGEVMVSYREGDVAGVPNELAGVDQRQQRTLEKLGKLRNYLCTTANVALTQCNTASGVSGLQMGQAISNFLGVPLLEAHFACYSGISRDYPTVDDPTGHWLDAILLNDYTVFHPEPGFEIQPHCDEELANGLDELQTEFRAKFVVPAQDYNSAVANLPFLLQALEQCESEHCKATGGGAGGPGVPAGFKPAEGGGEAQLGLEAEEMGQNEAREDMLGSWIALQAFLQEPPCRPIPRKCQPLIERALSSMDRIGDEFNAITKAEMQEQEAAEKAKRAKRKVVPVAIDELLRRGQFYLESRQEFDALLVELKQCFSKHCRQEPDTATSQVAPDPEPELAPATNMDNFGIAGLGNTESKEDCAQALKKLEQLIREREADLAKTEAEYKKLSLDNEMKLDFPDAWEAQELDLIDKMRRERKDLLDAKRRRDALVIDGCRKPDAEPPGGGAQGAVNSASPIREATGANPECAKAMEAEAHELEYLQRMYLEALKANAIREKRMNALFDMIDAKFRYDENFRWKCLRSDKPEPSSPLSFTYRPYLQTSIINGACRYDAVLEYHLELRSGGFDDEPPAPATGVHPDCIDMPASVAVAGAGQADDWNITPTLRWLPGPARFGDRGAIRNVLSPLQAPNEPYFTSTGSFAQGVEDLWGLKRIGLYSADRGRGADPTPVTVAVIDSGLDADHPDLQGMVWRNSGETPDNGIDDDDNGLVDDVNGWNFIHNNSDTRDAAGHGTIVAGIIGAVPNNGIGIAGVNPWARIMPIKVTNYHGLGSSVDIAAGVSYAVRNGAKVINISMGGHAFSETEQAAIIYAQENDVLVVVAAGNDGTDAAGVWPAALDNVITVAALAPGDARAAYSNWGAPVDIAAPGSNILSLRARYTDPLAFASADYQPGDNIVGDRRILYHVSGTSFAAPFVAGVASLIRAYSPELDAASVRRMLLQSAADLGKPGVDPLTGYGLLDAAAALSLSPDFFIEALIQQPQPVQKDGEVVVAFIGTADADRFESAVVEIGEGESPERWRRIGKALGSPVRSGVLAEVSASELREAPRWTIRLTVTHGNGQTRTHWFEMKLK
ncbi:MAG: hypothetical protein CME59_23000 [Halioglobus sp.]|nr:hypothetical protein [Halioglobus sp.]